MIDEPQDPEMSETRKYNCSDYVKIQDQNIYELIQGTLAVLATPTPTHQMILCEIEFALNCYIRKRKLGHVLHGPCAVLLNEQNVFHPDIMFISQKRSDIITAKNIAAAPDLVIEVLSEATAYRDLIVKRRIYARCGVTEFWAVDPKERNIDVLLQDNGKFKPFRQFTAQDTLNSQLLGAFALPLQEIFKNLGAQY